MRDLVNKYEKILLNEGIDPENLSLDQMVDYLGLEIDKTWHSGMNRWDYTIAFMSGVIGGIIPNLGKDANGDFTLGAQDSFMRDSYANIHDNAATRSFSEDNNFFSKLFSHKGDAIDRVSDAANINNVPYDMHRLYSGHDVFQFSEGNIFSTMSEQYGGLGYAKAFVHLFYDFFSKRGLPLPGSSNFADTMYNEWSSRSPQIYENYFTLNARDLTGTTATLGLLKVYRWLDTKYWTKRPHSVDIPRYHRLNMLAHSINIVVGLAAGTFNYFSVAAFGKAAVHHQILSWNKTKSLGKEVDLMKERIAQKPIDDRSIEQIVNDLDDEFEN